MIGAGLEESWNGSEALSSGVVIADGKSSEEAETKVISDVAEVADDVTGSVSSVFVSFVVGFTLNGKAVRAGDGDAGASSPSGEVETTAVLREVNQEEARI